MEFTKQPHDNIPASRAALKLALFAVLVFIIGALQVSLFSKVRLFSATPDILLAFVLGLGVFDGERTGAVIGVWAGVVSDALGGSVLMFSPFFYLMAGYLAGIAVKTLLGKNFPSWLIQLCGLHRACRDDADMYSGGRTFAELCHSSAARRASRIRKHISACAAGLLSRTAALPSVP